MLKIEAHSLFVNFSLDTIEILMGDASDTHLMWPHIIKVVYGKRGFGFYLKSLLERYLTTNKPNNLTNQISSN